MYSLQTQLIKNCLQLIKDRLKAKDISYRDLAEHMDVSVVTVKRLLNSSDISMERLMTLAEMVDCTLSELLSKAENNPQPHHVFSPKQDEYFDRYPNLMHYFFELFNLGKTPQEIAKSYKLNKTSTYLYLRALENIELVKLLPEDKVQFLIRPPAGFADDSRVLRKQLVSHIEKTHHVIMNMDSDSKNRRDYFMLVKPLHLSSALYDRMLTELSKIIDRFSEISELAENQNQDHPDYVVNLACHPGESVQLEAIGNIKPDFFD